jgi:hypothetical protein
MEERACGGKRISVGKRAGVDAHKYAVQSVHKYAVHKYVVHKYAVHKYAVHQYAVQSANVPWMQDVDSRAIVSWLTSSMTRMPWMPGVDDDLDEEKRCYEGLGDFLEVSLGFRV